MSRNPVTVPIIPRAKHASAMNHPISTVLSCIFVTHPIHSEEITDHDMAYYLLNKYLREHEGYVKIKKFWQDHTKAIRQFHRYPHRNKILGRESTEEEIAFLNGPNSSW